MEIFIPRIQSNYKWVYPEAHSQVKYKKNFMAIFMDGIWDPSEWVDRKNCLNFFSFQFPL